MFLIASVKLSLITIFYKAHRISFTQTYILHRPNNAFLYITVSLNRNENLLPAIWITYK